MITRKDVISYTIVPLTIWLTKKAPSVDFHTCDWINAKVSEKVAVKQTGNTLTFDPLFFSW